MPVVEQYPGLGPELQQIVLRILAILGPLLQAASPADGGEPPDCQQVWCPVCALVAVSSGKQHPLTAIVAEHGTALLTLIHGMVTSEDPKTTEDRSDPSPDGPGRYQPIAVTIHE